jgi:hypothetical protein
MKLNAQARLSPSRMKSILMETGDSSDGLAQKVASGKRLNCYQALYSLSSAPLAAPLR